MAGVSSALYNLVGRRTSTFAVAIVGGAFFFERTYDIACRSIFDNINKGKQWKDIKHNYEK